MISTTKTCRVELELNPKDIALFFCMMNSRDQAEFFNEIAEQVKAWDAPFDFQMQSLIDEKVLTSGGQKIMKTIGDYSN